MSSNNNRDKLTKNLESSVSPIPRHVQTQLLKQEKESKASLLADNLLKSPDLFMFDEEDRRERDIFFAKAFMHLIGGISASLISYKFILKNKKQSGLLLKSLGVFSVFLGANYYCIYRYHTELKNKLIIKYPV